MGYNRELTSRALHSGQPPRLTASGRFAWSPFSRSPATHQKPWRHLWATRAFPPPCSRLICRRIATTRPQQWQGLPGRNTVDSSSGCLDGTQSIGLVKEILEIYLRYNTGRPWSEPSRPRGDIPHLILNIIITWPTSPLPPGDQC